MGYKQLQATIIREYIAKRIIEGTLESDIKQDTISKYKCSLPAYYRHYKIAKTEFIKSHDSDIQHRRAVISARYEQQYADTRLIEDPEKRIKVQCQICDSVARLYGVDKSSVTTTNIFNYFPAQSTETKDIIADYKIVKSEDIISNAT